MSKLDLKFLPDPGNKYKIGLKLGGGTGGEVYEAVESLTGKKVAIKMIELKKETENEIKREYYVLKELSANENFPEFFGIFLKKGKENCQKVWLVIEFCEGGTALDLVRKLEHENRKVSEIHLAYILRETIKAVIHLHENDIAHRDIRGSNILLTGDGRVKLIDYGISKRVEKNKKMHTCVGSPSWVAPEVIACQKEEESVGYDKKADVWAIGITAIELADGQAPFEDMHPGRALFQIVQNPPPTLRKASEWSQVYNDFISECLVKNPENRPCAQELLAHTFFEPLDKEENLLDDMKALLENYKNINIYKRPDIQIRKGYMVVEHQTALEKILQEDLAALNDVTEDTVLSELYERLKINEFHTFIGDILLILNPNQYLDIYGTQYHKKYRFKAKSQNAPHIYAIAESAYRDVFHHEKPQHVLFAGETGSGKTVNMRHAMDHLLFLGQGLKSSEKIEKALNLIQTMCNASTPHSRNSTRHTLQTQLTFTDTGKVSGAVFRIYLLEKERVTTTAKKQANFHLFYQFYDAIKSEGKLADFLLRKDVEYTYLKSGLDSYKDSNSEENITQYKLFEKNLIDLEFEEEQINSIENILAAILLIGEIEFTDDEDGNGVLALPEVVQNVSELLNVDNKKLSWALLNYCLIVKGEAIMRHNSKQEAEEARNVLARGLYSRLADWVINKINEKLSVSRVIYGDKHVVSLLDFYGFECYKKNTLNQLFVNIINEELQCHYNQKIFVLAKQTAEEEGVPFSPLEFSDNKEVLEQIISKQDGLLYKIDEATRTEDSTTLLGSLKTSKKAPVFAENAKEFSINHYTGKITYDASEMPEKNRDFLPPEIIETMRLSTQELTKELFSPLLSKSGNLTKEFGKQFEAENSNAANKNKNKEKNVNTTPAGQFSQTRQMRTAAATFRGARNDILKNLTLRESGFHYVRCIRTDLSDKSGAFNPEIVRQQLRALAVVNTVLTTQQGYSYSVSHNEFIRRYKFLAFDFDENVEETKENCRLLLLRLKLEGWTMGKTKVFLKYYNKEYLSRLYETQIKKIVKVQSMMRAFMARRKLYAKIKRYQVDADKKKYVREEINEALEAKAAAIIQRRYREYTASKYDLTEKQKVFIRPWYKRWRAKSIFQVLLLYRAQRLQTIVNFCLQIHIYNQNFINDIRKTNGGIILDEVHLEANPEEYLPPSKPIFPKLLFTWESLKLRGDVTNCEKLPDCNVVQLESEILNKLTKKRTPDSEEIVKQNPKKYEDKEIQVFLNDDDFSSRSKNQPDMDSIKAQSAEEENDKTTPGSKELLREIMQKEKNESESSLSESNEPVPKTDPNTVLNIMMVKNALNNLRRNDDDSPSSEEYNDNFQETRIQALRSRPLSKKIPNKSEIRTHPEQKLRNSISEMEDKFRNVHRDENGDNPPFNFRAILKKTNYTRDVRKPQDENVAFSNEINTLLERKKKSLGFPKFNAIHHQPEAVSVQLAPGILIHGKIADL